MATLFGYLASRFSSHPENLATEALRYIFATSKTATTALLEMLSDIGVPLVPPLSFRSQEAIPDKGIPDLKCFDSAGSLSLIIESKFWAGLTDHQPGSYLQALNPEKPSVLLFVVPAARLERVWGELARRLSASGTPVPEATKRLGLYYAPSADKQRIAVVSWAMLLERIGLALTVARDEVVQGDVAQLKGLADAQDEEAILPFRDEEITNLLMPRRMMELANIVAKLCQLLINDGVGDIRGKRESHGWYSAGRYIRLASIEAWLGVHLGRWRESGVGPLWVIFYEELTRANSLILRELAPWQHMTPARCFADEQEVAVALLLTAGLEEPELLDSLVKQVKELTDKLVPVVMATWSKAAEEGSGVGEQMVEGGNTRNSQEGL